MSSGCRWPIGIAAGILFAAACPAAVYAQVGGLGTLSLCRWPCALSPVPAGTPPQVVAGQTADLAFVLTGAGPDTVGAITWAIPPGFSPAQDTDPSGSGYVPPDGLVSHGCPVTLVSAAGSAITVSIDGCKPGGSFALPYRHVAVPTTVGTATVAATFDGEQPIANPPKLVIIPADPSQLQFTTEPADTVAGQPITPSVAVEARDPYGNLVIDTKITLSLSSVAGNAVLIGKLTEPANGGRATFPDLRIDKAGRGDILIATDGDARMTSNAFSVRAGPPVQLAFSAEPGGTPRKGKAFPEQPSVIVTDPFANPVQGVAISLAIAAGTGGKGAGLTCSGVLPVLTSVAGVATFTGCAIDMDGRGYRLTATTGDLAATSAAFDVSEPVVSPVIPVRASVWWPSAAEGGAAFLGIVALATLGWHLVRRPHPPGWIEVVPHDDHGAVTLTEPISATVHSLRILVQAGTVTQSLEETRR